MCILKAQLKGKLLSIFSNLSLFTGKNSVIPEVFYRESMLSVDSC